MTRIAFPVIGIKPTVNLFRSIRHEAPANDNDWSSLIRACDLIRIRAGRAWRKALRLVRK